MLTPLCIRHLRQFHVQKNNNSTSFRSIIKVCEALAVLKISFSVFKGYIFNIWTLFDTAAIITTLVAMRYVVTFRFIERYSCLESSLTFFRCSWNDANPGKYLPGLNAFVIGLLWIKVLGFLKVVNKEMSTFILALIQILWDLRFFAIVLVIVIFMFADMVRGRCGLRQMTSLSCF